MRKASRKRRFSLSLSLTLSFILFFSFLLVLFVTIVVFCETKNRPLSRAVQCNSDYSFSTIALVSLAIASSSLVAMTATGMEESSAEINAVSRVFALTSLLSFTPANAR